MIDGLKTVQNIRMRPGVNTAISYLGVAEAAKRVGVTVSTMKRWADDGQVPCLKTHGGHRRFRTVDVDALLERMSVRSGEAQSRDEEWLGLLLQPDEYALTAGLFASRGRLGAWYRVGEEVARALRLLGTRWANGDLGVLDEHLASERLRRALGHVVNGIPTTPDLRTCLLVTPSGEEHTLGLSIAELCLREAGWQSRFGGGPLSASLISDHLAKFPVAMVAAAAAPSSLPTRRLSRWAAEVGAACLQKRVSLVLGGRGPWPPRVRGAVRIDSFTGFHEFLTDLKEAA
jgi:MerR family transcriptional regulator, light-induced transcriptional regulator